MAQLNLGKVKFVWRGPYNPATVYQKDDVASYLGSAWVCKTANTVNVAPEEPSANWDVMARGIVATAFTQALLTAPTAAAARTVLELGTAAVANIGTAAGNVLGADNATAFTIGFLQALNAGEARTALGLGTAATQAATAFQPAGSYQAQDTTLTALAAVTTAANKLIYATGADTFTTADLTAFARTLLAAADAAAARTVLGVPIIGAPAAVPTTSGTAIDFTGIPAGTKRITVNFARVSTNGSSLVQVQLGTSGGVETSGYVGTAEAAGAVAAFSSGMLAQRASGPTEVSTGQMVLTLVGANQWVCSAVVNLEASARVNTSAGAKTLSGVLDRIRLTTVNGTDTFDAGSVSILYEG